jgi:hypothetical protein
MTKLLHKGHHGVIAQLCSLDVQTYRPFIPVDLQKIINNHSKAFGEIPKDLLLGQDHDHAIRLQLRNVPSNISSYMHPCAQKSEIECMV